MDWVMTNVLGMTDSFLSTSSHSTLWTMDKQPEFIQKRKSLNQTQYSLIQKLWVEPSNLFQQVLQ